MSAVSEIAQPPPTQKPWTIAISGFSSVVVLRRAPDAGLLELGDVGARDERDVPLAAQHHHPHGRVRSQVGHRLGDLPPHLHGDGVAALGLVEDDPAQGPFLLDANAAAHGRAG
jgi:hypothetical protein